MANPAATYAVVGALPAGLAFNTTTRVLSGTPTAAGNGTITIRATNSVGTDDWTVAYTFTAADVAPSFADNTGDAQNWTVGTAITSITIPRASGIPNPTYQLISSPDGITVTLPTTGADGTITGTPTAVGSGTVWIRALNSEGSANWNVAYTTVADVDPLTLADSDDTGLDVDCKALLVASAPGTAGSDPYADSDRGGTDTPLDGELGLGATNTVISRFRRLVAAEFTLNDDDNPAALDLGPYFDAGGDGNDLTIYLQTLEDGEVSFSAASQYLLGGTGWARFTLPADAQTLLNNLGTGDRWIFKVARPAATTPTTVELTAAGARSATRTGAGAFATTTPTTVNLTAAGARSATRTGAGQFTATTETAPVAGYQSIALDAAWWAQITGSQRGWDPPAADRPAINSGLALGGATDRELEAFGVYSSGVVRLSIENGDLTDAFEANGGVRLTIGSQSWIFLLAGADMGVPYFWSPSNAAGAIEAHGLIASATAGTLEISDDPDTDFADTSTSTALEFTATGARSASRTGAGQFGTTIVLPAVGARSVTRTGAGQFIATSPTTVVFTASGARSATRAGVGAFVATTAAGPTTYAVVGSLPAGITFNTATRVISGIPTAAGSGTITIRASNGLGSDDWTVDYTFVVAAPLEFTASGARAASRTGVGAFGSTVVLAAVGARSASRTGAGQFIATSPTTVVFAASGARSDTRTGAGAFTATTAATVTVEFTAAGARSETRTGAGVFVTTAEVVPVSDTVGAGTLLLLPSGAYLLLPDGTRLLLPAEAFDTRGVVVLVAGELMPATGDWWIRLSAGETSLAGARIDGRRSQFTRLPRDGDEFEIRAGGEDGTVIFGGYLDEPNPEILAPDIVSYSLGAVGWRARLDGESISQADGRRIVKLATGGDQIEALVGLVSGEGFTAEVSLDDDVPVRDDMRFRFAGPLVDHIASVNRAIVVVRPNKKVITRSRSRIVGEVELDWSILESIKIERSRENFKTSLTVRGGALTQLESHTGRDDGRYRLGGEHNLEPQQSLFDVSIGNGVLWTDSRDRGGEGRGNTDEAVLVVAADTSDLLPTSVVSGADRSIDLLSIEAKLWPFDPLVLPVHVGNGLRVRFKNSRSESVDSQLTDCGGILSSSFLEVVYKLEIRPPTNTWVPIPGTELRFLGIRRNTYAGYDPCGNYVGSPNVNSVNIVLDGETADLNAFLAVAKVAVRRESDGEIRVLDFAGNAWVTNTGFWNWVSGEMTVALFVGEYASETSIGIKLEGITLLDTALADVGLLAQAEDGTEYGWLLADLSTEDDTEPYFWPGTSAIGLDNAAVAQNVIARLRAGVSKLVLVDTTHARVDFANKALFASDTVVELEVLSLETVDVDNVQQSIGGAEDGWCWNAATQELEEIVPSSPPPTTVNVRYKARYVVTESSGVSPAIDAVVIEEGIALPSDARIHARSLLDLDSLPIEEAVAKLKPGLGKEIVEGSGATIQQDILDFFGISGVQTTDVWRIEKIEIRPRGLRYQQTLRLLRRGARTDARDTWRRTFGS